jgi:hypothetical protein
VAPLKRQAVIRLVREKIADGTLRPGSPAPFAAALASLAASADDQSVFLGGMGQRAGGLF